MVKSIYIAILMLIGINLYPSDSPKHFISGDLLGLARTPTLYYGHTIFDMTKEDETPTFLTLNLGIAISRDNDEIQTRLPRIPLFLRFIAGEDVCFELEGGVVIGGQDKADIKEAVFISPKRDFIDFPFGFGISFMWEPIYLRYGLGYVYATEDTGYMSLGIGVVW